MIDSAFGLFLPIQAPAGREMLVLFAVILAGRLLA